MLETGRKWKVPNTRRLWESILGKVIVRNALKYLWEMAKGYEQVVGNGVVGIMPDV